MFVVNLFFHENKPLFEWVLCQSFRENLKCDVMVVRLPDRVSGLEAEVNLWNLKLANSSLFNANIMSNTWIREHVEHGACEI